MSGAQQADQLTRNIWRCAAITAFVYNTDGSPASYHHYYVFSAAWTLLGVLLASDNVMSDDLILSTGSPQAVFLVHYFSLSVLMTACCFSSIAT